MLLYNYSDNYILAIQRYENILHINMHPKSFCQTFRMHSKSGKNPQPSSQIPTDLMRVLIRIKNYSMVPPIILVSL